MLLLPDLPITPILPDLRTALIRTGQAVLEAPPGAGKTTLVPLSLLDEPWLGGQRIVMLEPRRLAARAAAARISEIAGDHVGGTVGYRIRLESRVSARTRIEVVTEGILTRMMQSDPGVRGCGIIILDEFHERNLPSDLGLALAIESREVLRPDLRLLVMSATLDGERVAGLLGGAPRIRSEGRLFPVETHHLDGPPDGRIEDLTARAARRALDETSGDVLVFLPGAGEIRRTAERLGDLGEGVIVAPLYGALPAEAQDRAIRPDAGGRRKVILATDIAETSLTIEGVETVVDAGLVRRPRFDVQTGMEQLETVRIARDSAEQRRGRAGRLGPGTCYRLWSEFEHAALAETSAPEILLADLAPLALELAAWGTANPAELRFLDQPSPEAFREARDLLAALEVLDERGALTKHGREMVGLGLHPRLGHLVLRGRTLGLGSTATRLAALLHERDVLQAPGPEPLPADVRLRLDALERRASSVHGLRVHGAAASRAGKDAQRWQRRLAIPGDPPDPEAAGLLLAFAYPDRVAQRVPGSDTRYRLRSGRQAMLAEADPLAGSDFLAIAHLGGLGRLPRITLAAPIEGADLLSHFAHEVETVDEVRFDDASLRVVAAREERLGAVVLGSGPLPDLDPGAVAAALMEAVLARGLRLLPWTKDATQLRERLEFAHRIEPESFPSTTDEALIERADQWLLPHLYGLRSLDDLRRVDLGEALLTGLDWEARRELDRLAPTHETVPSGSRIRIDYSDPETPVLAVRLQEVFGLIETPRIGGGAVPLTLHLLSPAHRPVQVTRDLESFWRETYFDVRKDLRGRYPKHHWPEDPLKAEPTRRTKGKMRDEG